MARPLHADADETRRLLVDAALALFAAHGFHGVSTRELADRAGVNAAMLSHYFGGKQGLYDAAVDEVYRRLGARTQQAFAGASLDDVKELWTRVYDAARAERDGIRLLVRQVLDGGRLTPHTEAKHFLPQLELAARTAAALVGCTPAHARAAAVTLGYLVSRYVIQDERSLAAAFGVRSKAAARARVIATLVTTADALLRP